MVLNVTLTKEQKKKTWVAKMRLLRSTAGYALFDYELDEDVVQEPRIFGTDMIIRHSGVSNIWPRSDLVVSLNT